MIELTGLCSVRGYGGGGRQSGDAAKRLSTTVLDTSAVTRRGGRRQSLVVPDGSPDHWDLVEFMPAVVMAQSRRAGAGSATPDATILPGTGVGTTAAGASTSSPAPKRLHQSLGAWRHSTEMIQPSGLRFLLSCPKPPEYTPGDVHLKFTRFQLPSRDGIKLLHKFRPLENKFPKIQ